LWFSLSRTLKDNNVQQHRRYEQDLASCNWCHVLPPF
jgi:hypothetical protein